MDVFFQQLHRHLHLCLHDHLQFQFFLEFLFKSAFLLHLSCCLCDYVWFHVCSPVNLLSCPCELCHIGLPLQLTLQALLLLLQAGHLPLRDGKVLPHQRIARGQRLHPGLQVGHIGRQVPVHLLDVVLLVHDSGNVPLLHLVQHGLSIPPNIFLASEIPRQVNHTLLTIQISFFQAEVAIHNVKTDKKTGQQDTLVTDQKSLGFVVLGNEHLALFHQHLDIVAQLLLHRGKPQPGPGSACIRPDNREIPGGGGDLLCLVGVPFDQLQNLPELSSPLQQRESLGFEAVSEAQLQHNKQLVEDNALLVQLSSKPETCLDYSSYDKSSNSHQVVSLHCAAFFSPSLAPSLLHRPPVNKQVRPLIFPLPSRLLVAVEISTTSPSTELAPQPGSSV